jgi:hypothetical protein
VAASPTATAVLPHRPVMVLTVMVLTVMVLSDHLSNGTHGRYTRPDQRRRPFKPGVQCAACKRVGHEAVNCDMLAIALFIDRYTKKDLTATDKDRLEQQAYPLEGKAWNARPNPSSGHEDVLGRQQYHRRLPGRGYRLGMLARVGIPRQQIHLTRVRSYWTRPV